MPTISAFTVSRLEKLTVTIVRALDDVVVRDDVAGLVGIDEKPEPIAELLRGVPQGLPEPGVAVELIVALMRTTPDAARR